VTVLVTLRVDFLGECGSVILDDAGLRLDVVAYDPGHRVFIPWLGREQLRAAIEGPAQRVGIKLEAGLVSRMLEAVGAEPGALPLLSYTLDLLGLRREGRTLTQAGYEAVGQVAGALTQHADTLIGKMSATEQQLAQRLFVRLVHLGDGVGSNSRQRVPITRLLPREKKLHPLFDGVTKSLTDARLLLRAEEGQEPSLEVAHEALIRCWPQLQKWLTEDRELLSQLGNLEAMLVQWREHKAILSGEQLSFVRRFAKEHEEEFSSEAQALLKASEKQEQKIRLWKQLLAATLMSLTLIFGYLYYKEHSAHRAYREVHDQITKQINRSGQNTSAAELLRILIGCRLALGGTPSEVSTILDKALELEPHNPELLNDRAELLLAQNKLDAVYPIAAQILSSVSESGPRLRLLLIAWSAAHLQGPIQRAQDAAWAERLVKEYARLQEGMAMDEAEGEAAQLLINRRFLPVGRPRRDILEVLGLLRTRKSEATVKQLAQQLEVKL
jgi:hypothetical protein